MKRFLIILVIIIIVFLGIYPLLEFDTGSRIIKFSYSGDTSLFEDRACYDDGYFYIVTYAKSQKTIEVESNCNVSLCNKLYRFNGKAYNIGHPLKEENRQIRSRLIKAFEPWYFAHNNEDDENMCCIKVELDNGFFYKDGTCYRINF